MGLREMRTRNPPETDCRIAGDRSETDIRGRCLPVLVLVSIAILLLAPPAAALNSDYWRGGWRTPLGEAPHIYEFVIRGTRVTGVYCRNCSDATTIGFIDGTWDEKA